ncbi:hypothetical protein P558_02228, partial [Staphylococcus aureus M1417]
NDNMSTLIPKNVTISYKHYLVFMSQDQTLHKNYDV